MTLDCLHIVERAALEPGSVMVSLQHLPRTLAPLGITSEIKESMNGSPRTTGCIHIHGWGYPAALDAARRARAGKIPYIISPHGALHDGPHRRSNWIDRLRKKMTVPKLIDRAKAVTALNDHEQRALSDEFRREITSLSYGLNATEFEPQLPKPESDDAGIRRQMAVVGRVTPQSGCVALLKTLAELGAVAENWDVIFIVPEEDAMTKSLRAAVTRKGASSRVRFEITSNEQSAARLMRASQLVASPAMHVMFPGAIMQALANGVPAFAANCATFNGAENIVATCPPTREGMRAALGRIMQADIADRAAQSSRCKDFAKSHMDWSVQAPRFAKLYT